VCFVVIPPPPSRVENPPSPNYACFLIAAAVRSEATSGRGVVSYSGGLYGTVASLQPSVPVSKASALAPFTTSTFTPSLKKWNLKRRRAERVRMDVTGEHRGGAWPFSAFQPIFTHAGTERTASRFISFEASDDESPITLRKMDSVYCKGLKGEGVRGRWWKRRD